MIPVKDYCEHYKVELTFLNSLQEYGLIEISTIEKNQFFSKDDLADIERMMRLHYDLEINMEGIDAISHLLDRMKHLNQELISLTNKVRMYENK